MPSSSSKPSRDLSAFDALDAIEAIEEVNKVKTNKKNKKKNEAAVAEASGQEKATKPLKDDRYSLEGEQITSRVADSNSQDLQKIPFFSQMSPKQLPNTYTSPVLVALGDAFRDKYKPQEEADYDIFSTSPQKEEAIDNNFPPSPQSRPQPTANPVEEIRGGFSRNSPPTTSPRLAYRQLSRRPSGYQTEAFATSPRGRPVSMPSNMYHLPSPSGLNLNQMRGITNDILGDTSRSTSRKASKYNFMALDSLAVAGDLTTSSSDDILLAAYENSLQVFNLSRDKASRIGKIEGLRGYVVSAKIIPSPNRRDPLRSLRPLVAIIVHGPEITGEELSRPSSRHSDHSFDPSYPHEGRSMPAVTKYQTSVEVYSLKQHVHVATLFTTTPEEPKIDNVFGKKSYEPPGPIGNLSVHVSDCYVAVASTESGEIYIYDIRSDRPEQRFRCIGKTWTSVLSKKSRTWSSSSASEEDNSRDRSPHHQRYEAPLLALQGRILAYVPPIASSISTIFGRVRVPVVGKEAPGLTSHTPSSQPVATCQVETPLDGSIVNDIARGVTQEMLKGAKWVGDQGKQAWKNYWNPKSPELNPQYDYATQNQQFPPTHAADDLNRAAQQPTIVSFLDLDKLSNSYSQRSESALNPIASFTLPGGCSFMNFSPSGLALLTASAKGDVQNVWDLMQLLYPISSVTRQPTSKVESVSTIRQVARFTRITTACIVDVVWLGSQGTKVAILTDRGTVHLHDLPAAALGWPPREDKLYAADFRNFPPVSQPSSPSGWGSALTAVSSGAQTISAAVRSNPLAQLSNFNLAQASAGAGAKGSKIVAAGISRSVEAASGTVSSIMSMGETRLHVPGTSKLVVPGSARWWFSKDGEAIAVVGDGLVRIHKVLLKKESKQGKRKYSVGGPRIAEFAVPEPLEKRDSDWDMVNDGFDVRGDWLSGPEPRKHSRSRSVTNPLSSAEIETNAPYRTLYKDHRIEFETYNDDSYTTDGNWAFGQPISSEPMTAPAHRQRQDLDSTPQPAESISESIADFFDRIEEALPISESPPKSKSKKGKKAKAKPPNPTPPLDESPWGDDIGPDDMNDLMI